jgi:hypothetical protein
VNQLSLDFIEGLNSHDEEYKIATLRSFLSESAQDLLDSFKLPPAQVDDITQLSINPQIFRKDVGQCVHFLNEQIAKCN